MVLGLSVASGVGTGFATSARTVRLGDVVGGVALLASVCLTGTGAVGSARTIEVPVENITKFNASSSEFQTGFIAMLGLIPRPLWSQCRGRVSRLEATGVAAFQDLRMLLLYMKLVFALRCNALSAFNYS